MPKGQFKNPEERAKKISDKAKRGQWFQCLICQKQFWRKPFEIKNGDNKFCSRQCYFKWQKGRPRSEEFKKKCRAIPSYKRPNWKGGISSINKRIRGSLEFKAWNARKGAKR